MYRSLIGKGFIAMAVGLALSGCGSSDSATTSGAAVSGSDSGAEQGQQIHVLNGWGAPGDAETWQALLDVHKRRHPADSITVEPLPMPGGDPPEKPGDVTMTWPTFMPDLSTLHPLNTFLASPSQADTVSNLYPELTAPAKDGSVYAVPIKLMRASSLYYNKYVFAAQHLNPPTTLDELRTVCETLRTAGVGCISSSAEGFLFEALVAASMGPDAYVRFRSGQRDEASLRNAIDVVTEVVDKYMYVNPGAVFDDFTKGKLAMVVDGSYQMAAFQQLGQTAGVDYGMATPPGTAGLFIYNFDGMAVASGTPYLQGALNLLDSAVSLDGVTAMCKYSKQIPVRKDVVLSNPDSELQGLVQDMKDAKHRVLTAALYWVGGVNSYLQSRDKEALVQAVLATP